ncbi:lytic polysaccharide monooxygenase [Cadophora sp. DSE1049]|nr:lytic polysaccharide monooxygenase [Cadophora sp. DSE1049]
MSHYRFVSLIVGTTITGEYIYVRQNTNMNSPVTDVTSNDIRCNVLAPQAGATTKTYTVAAGSTVGFQMDQPAYHPGPALAYLQKVTNASTADGSGAWFKIAQWGPTITPSAIEWPDSTNKPSFTFTIPSCVPAGQYLMRIEQIALHGANVVGGAQFYLSCAQLAITGGGTKTPTNTIALPGGYKTTDPGILIPIYWPIPTNYTMPGPSVFTC